MFRNLLFVFLTLSSIVAKAQLLQPSPTYAVTPADYGMTYKEVDILTDDQVKLYGWWFTPTSISSKKCIIMSDDGLGNMADNLELAGQFISMGYYVLMYDYRGYGKSDPFTLNSKFYIYAQFQKDMKAAVGWVKKYQAKMTVVYLWGKGIGAGLSICEGTADPKVTKVIADSPYTTFEDVQNKYLTAGEDKPLMPIGYDKNLLEPLYGLEGGPQLTGILYIVGSIDPYSKQEDIDKLIKIKKRISSDYIVDGKESAETFSSNTNEYFNQIKKFLGEQ